jgi:predicted Rossmann fold flavoprotein
MKNIVIIGGGAAGYFAAITCAEKNPSCKIVILEQSGDVLNKVRISGGGRCNVTHACFDPKQLVSYYPRGARELLGPFHIFSPTETIRWFESKGVKLKKEQDGRMFPVSDDSATIVHCLKKTASALGIETFTRSKVTDLRFEDGEWNSFMISSGDTVYKADKLLIATGSSPAIWKKLESVGYRIVPPVPSLFTFNISDKKLQALSGISFNHAELSIPGTKIRTGGPLLITHWGLSGPAILKASAWGAIELNTLDYHFNVIIDWIPGVSAEDIIALKTEIARKKIISNPPFGLPSRFWSYIVLKSGIEEETNWASVTGEKLKTLVRLLKHSEYPVTGKSTFKEEFVTAGGVDLKQINFKTFESRLHPGLYFAGEVLDIDALTGGFNFQAAWTGGFIAGTSMAD